MQKGAYHPQGATNESSLWKRIRKLGRQFLHIHFKVEQIKIITEKKEKQYQQIRNLCLGPLNKSDNPVPLFYPSLESCKGFRKSQRLGIFRWDLREAFTVNFGVKEGCFVSMLQ